MCKEREGRSHFSRLLKSPGKGIPDLHDARTFLILFLPGDLESYPSYRFMFIMHLSQALCISLILSSIVNPLVSVLENGGFGREFLERKFSRRLIYSFDPLNT